MGLLTIDRVDWSGVVAEYVDRAESRKSDLAVRVLTAIAAAGVSPYSSSRLRLPAALRANYLAVIAKKPCQMAADFGWMHASGAGFVAVGEAVACTFDPTWSVRRSLTMNNAAASCFSDDCSETSLESPRKIPEPSLARRNGAKKD